MGILTELGAGQGYLKAGFLGFPKSGKTYTATDLAIGLYKFFGNCGRIAMFDTEGGSEYIAHRVKAETGQALLGVKSRSFSDLMEVANEMKQDDILLVDSITHPWRELQEAHLQSVNKWRVKKGYERRTRLEFQDWGPIKDKWAEWTDFYLNSKVHIIICGRAGYEYEQQENEETGRKELAKTGTKMKTESEFGFEPSLLVEMERVDKTISKGQKQVVRYAFIRGDRFNLIDGEVFEDPTFKDFLPHIEMLKPGSHTPIDTSLKSSTGVGEDGLVSFEAEKKKRTILAEEIKAHMLLLYPGETREEKQNKTKMLVEVFGSGSWTKVEGTPSSELETGLAKMREMYPLAQDSATPAE